MNRSLDSVLDGRDRAPSTQSSTVLSTKDRARILEGVFKRIVDKEETNSRGAYATLSSKSRGRMRQERLQQIENRTPFARDRDRIIYSEAFFKLSEKTQVFLSPRNPLIADRLTHTLQVAQIARTIARAINANEDLAEAIALGHDLGHTPFGHTGEKVLDKKCQENGIGPFMHNVHSVRVIDEIEKNGDGLNLSWEVREGIICHNGEAAEKEIRPNDNGRGAGIWNWSLDEIAQPASTIEGCIVRICDKIAYAGKDIEDGIEAGIVTRGEVPSEYTAVLGETNSQIIDTLVKDVIVNFELDLQKFREEHGRDPEPTESTVRLSPEIGEAMNELIFNFNYKKIYLSDANTKYGNQTETIISGLFDAFIDQLRVLQSRPFTKLSDFDFEPPSEAEEAEEAVEAVGEQFQKRCFNLLLGKSMEELEAYKERLVNDFSVGKLVDIFTVEDDQATLRHAVEESKLSVFKDWYFQIIDDVRLRIIKDNWDDPKCQTKTSILSFLRPMSDDYILSHRCAEYVRDYVASLTDDLAIRIFKGLTIPESIV